MLNRTGTFYKPGEGSASDKEGDNEEEESIQNDTYVKKEFMYQNSSDFYGTTPQDVTKRTDAAVADDPLADDPLFAYYKNDANDPLAKENIDADDHFADETKVGDDPFAGETKVVGELFADVNTVTPVKSDSDVQFFATPDHLIKMEFPKKKVSKRKVSRKEVPNKEVPRKEESKEEVIKVITINETSLQHEPSVEIPNDLFDSSIKKLNSARRDVVLQPENDEAVHKRKRLPPKKFQSPYMVEKVAKRQTRTAKKGIDFFFDFIQSI
jgi:hypothetical protein